MRLALFTDTYAPQMNGVARTLSRLTDAVRARGGTVRVFTTTDPRACHQEALRWPSLQFPLYKELRLAWPTRRSVARALAEFRPTIVHAATPFGMGLCARACARRLNIPFVSSYHTSFGAYTRYYGVSWLEQPSWAYLRWFHNGGRRTFCPTHAIESEVAEHGFERLSVWGRGVDLDRFTPRKRSRAMRVRLGATETSVVIAYVGRIAREKGLDHLLDALGRVKRATNAVVFAFAGDGPHLEHCRSRAPEGSAFVGRLEGEELAAFYASADVFVFPSDTDTFGNVLLEAMASGLAIVGADTGPTREIAGPAAVRYRPRDADALAGQLIGLATDARRRATHAEAGLLRASSYSWDAAFDGIVAEYRDAMN